MRWWWKIVVSSCPAAAVPGSGASVRSAGPGAIRQDMSQRGAPNWIALNPAHRRHAVTIWHTATPHCVDMAQRSHKTAICAPAAVCARARPGGRRSPAGNPLVGSEPGVTYTRTVHGRRYRAHPPQSSAQPAAHPKTQLIQLTPSIRTVPSYRWTMMQIRPGGLTFNSLSTAERGFLDF